MCPRVTWNQDRHHRAPGYAYVVPSVVYVHARCDARVADDDLAAHLVRDLEADALIEYEARRQRDTGRIAQEYHAHVTRPRGSRSRRQ